MVVAAMALMELLALPPRAIAFDLSSPYGWVTRMCRFYLLSLKPSSF